MIFSSIYSRIQHSKSTHAHRNLRRCVRVSVEPRWPSFLLRLSCRQNKRERQRNARLPATGLQSWPAGCACRVRVSSCKWARGRAATLLPWQRSVEADGVKERPVALLLKLLQKFIHLVLHVISVLDLRRERRASETQAQTSFGEHFLCKLTLM